MSSERTRKATTVYTGNSYKYLGYVWYVRTYWCVNGHRRVQGLSPVDKRVDVSYVGI